MAVALPEVDRQKNDEQASLSCKFHKLLKENNQRRKKQKRKPVPKPEKSVIFKIGFKLLNLLITNGTVNTVWTAALD